MWPGEVRSCLGCWNLAISFLIFHDSSSSQKNPPLSFTDLRKGSADSQFAGARDAVAN